MSRQLNKFHLSACGGTFDLFHKGHKDFLNQIFGSSEQVIIGLTSDKFITSKKVFEDFGTRKKALQEFLYENNYKGTIVPIDDVYGPTIQKKYDLDAIFVTADSLGGAYSINEKREDLGFKKLEIVDVALLKSEDGKSISSNRIKNGEIDRDGKLYIGDDLIRCDYLLPKDLRKKLSEPFGELISDLDEYLKKEELINRFIVTIGDVTTQKFVKNKITPKLSIVDLLVNRIKKFEKINDLGLSSKKIIKVDNPAGQITAKLTREIKKFFDKYNESLVIQINGEDDLAVIPAVLAAPLKCEIYYGQPGEGVVKIVVTEKIKEDIKDLISKFTRKVI